MALEPSNSVHETLFVLIFEQNKPAGKLAGTWTGQVPGQPETWPEVRQDQLTEIFDDEKKVVRNLDRTRFVKETWPKPGQEQVWSAKLVEG